MKKYLVHFQESHPFFEIIVQGGLGGLWILSNLLMLQTFNKALQNSSTTIQVSIVNTASNFIVTAVIGKVAFDEHLSLVWWCGTTLILAGIYLISSDRNHGGNNKLE